MRYLLFLLLALPVMVSAQQTLTVVDAVDSTAVPFATVTKIRAGGSITDMAGRVRLPLQPGDTIFIQHITYYDSLMEYNGQDTIWLKPVVIMLDEVLIGSDTLPMAFKRETDRTPVMVPGLNRLPQEYYDARIKELYPFYSRGLGAKQMELIYQFFNKKKYDQLKKLQELYDQEDQEKLYRELFDLRLSIDAICIMLDCDTFYAEEVRRHFNPGLEYLKNASDYQLVQDLKSEADGLSIYRFESDKK